MENKLPRLDTDVQATINGIEAGADQDATW